MRPAQSSILLAVFILSASIIPAVEFGHDLLHTFTNPFHTHTLRQKSASSHSMADHHHFRKMRFAHEMQEAHSPGNLIWFAYCFFNEAETFKGIQNSRHPDYAAPLPESDYLVTLLPPVPPPQPCRG